MHSVWKSAWYFLINNRITTWLLLGMYLKECGGFFCLIFLQRFKSVFPVTVTDKHLLTSNHPYCSHTVLWITWTKSDSDFCVLKEKRLRYSYVILKSKVPLKPRTRRSEVKEPLAGHRDPNLLCRRVSSESRLSAWWPEGTSDLYKTRLCQSKVFQLGSKTLQRWEEAGAALGCSVDPKASTGLWVWQGLYVQALVSPHHTSAPWQVNFSVSDNQKLQCVALGKIKVRLENSDHL